MIPCRILSVVVNRTRFDISSKNMSAISSALSDLLTAMNILYLVALSRTTIIVSFPSTSGHPDISSVEMIRKVGVVRVVSLKVLEAVFVLKCAYVLCDVFFHSLPVIIPTDRFINTVMIVPPKITPHDHPIPKRKITRIGGGAQPRWNA